MQEESAAMSIRLPNQRHLCEPANEGGLDLKEATRAIYLQAKQAWYSFTQAENRVQLSEKELEAAEENYRIVKTRFDGGLEIPNSLLRAQIGLTSAQHAAVAAIFEHNLARIRLLNLMGE